LQLVIEKIKNVDIVGQIEDRMAGEDCIKSQSAICKLK